MFESLYPLLQRPKLFEKTPGRFWNDPHISKGMLEAHLDPNTDTASRKPETIDRATEWIASLLTADAAVLDIGCGPGLYTSRLARRGLRVTGLDFSERSIAYAREHDPRSAYVLMDYLEMAYHEAFDMITLIFCDYGALVPKDRRTLLERVHRALKPGGRFLMDVFTPAWMAGRSERTEWEARQQAGFWSEQPHVRLFAEYLYKDNVNAGRTVVITKDEVCCYNIWNTCFTPESLARELEAQGFICDSIYGDVTDTAYSKESKTLCAVAKKAGNG